MKKLYLYHSYTLIFNLKKIIFLILFTASCFQAIYSQQGWFQQTSPVNVDLTSISFINDITGYACGGTKIIKTTNSGASWFVFDSTFATENYTKIQFINQNTGFISFGYNSRYVYKTTNSGLNWILMSSYSSRFGMVDNSFGWIFDYNYMTMTSDCGNSWYTGGNYPLPHGGASGGSLGSRNFGVIVGYYDDFMHSKMYMYILRSLNGGSSWECVGGGYPGDPCAYYCIYLFMPPPMFTNSYVVDDYLAFIYGGTQNFRSDNSGASWGYLNIGSSIAGFDFINHNTGYAVGGSGLIQYTTTSGAAWNQQTTPVSVQMNAIDMVNSTTGWAVGSAGVILKTYTGGLVLPLAPSLISPVDNSTGIQLTPLLDWDDNLQAVNYRLQLSDDSNFSNILIDNNTLTQSQYSIPSGLLAYATLYYWRVQAKNTVDWGPFSATWSFRTFDLPAQVSLSSPLNNSIELPTSITFKWYIPIETLNKNQTMKFSNPDIFAGKTGSDGINKYWFELTTDTVTYSGIIKDSTLTDTSKYIDGLNTGTSYYWRVKANNPLGWGPFSGWWKFTTTLGPPQQTVLFSPANHSIQQPANLIFKWYKTIEISKDFVIGNHIESSRSNTFSKQLKGHEDAITGYWFELTTDTISLAGHIVDSTLTDTSKTINLPGNSAQYYWRVKAKNSSGYGLFSPWWKFITVPSQSGWYLQASNIGSACTGISFVNSQYGWISNATTNYYSSVYKTTNGGDSWFISALDVFDMISQDIAFKDTLNGVIASSPTFYNRAVWRTTDGGSNWTADNEWTMFQYAEFNSITIHNGNEWKCGTVSIATWDTFPPPRYSSINGEMFPHRVRLNRIRSGYENVWTVGNEGLIYRDYTQVGNWNPAVSLWGLSFPVANTGYVCGGAYLFKTTDNAASWNRIIPLNDQTSYNDLHFFDGNTGIVACTLPGGEGAIMGTTDGGNSWNLQYVGQYSGNDFCFINGSTGWLLCGNSVLKTGSGGGPPLITAPVLLSPPNDTTGLSLTPVLDWSNVTSAVKYKLQVSEQSNFSNNLIDDSTITLSQYSIPNGILNTGIKYYWRAAASNDTIWSQFSDTRNFRTRGMPDQTVLYNPQNNSVNQPADITFSWFKTNETLKKSGKELQNEKVLKRKQEAGIIFNKDEFRVDAIGNYWFELTSDTVTLSGLVRDTLLTDTIKVINGLNLSAKYYWRVKAKGDLGWGQFSTWWNFTTVPPPPAVPVLALPLNNSAGLNLPVALIWNQSPSAVSYKLQLSADSLFTSFIINDSTQTDTLEIAALLNPLTNYYWRVAAKNAGGWSAFSEKWSFKTLGIPNLVVLVSPQNNAIDQPVNIMFLWNKAVDQQLKASTRNIKMTGTDRFSKGGNDAIGYYWFELTTDTITFAGLIKDTLLTDTVKLVNGLNNTTSYYWRVKAKNEIGWGSFSVWFKFTTLTVLNVNITYTSDWNMVSLPVNANPNGVRSLFPNCTPPAFYYNNGYQSDTILIPGKGYWLFFNNGGTQNLFGLPVNPQVIPVMQDWNMIGVFENNVPVNSITSSPPGIISSNFFMYSNGYTIADTLKPGSAYWVNVTQAGNLILPSSADKLSTVFKEKENQNVLNANLVRLIISDNSGKNSILYLGRKEELQGTYMLPPLPPAGIFDARFGSDLYIEMLGQGKHVINIQTGKYPVKIKTENLTGLKLQLKDNITGKLVDRVLTDNTEITVNEHISSFVLIEEELPKVFSLSQNYPNPFNPLTHIKFGIPVKTNVKLVIYDLLGQEVRTLVNELKDAGYYTVEFNAFDISSGVYFYRIEAGSFTDVKKLIVIK